MSKIRVLLADDHETVLARVQTGLREEFEIVGVVRNGLDAVAEVRRLEPDILVMDISMPILDGLNAASQLQAAKLETRVIFLTVHKDKDFVAAAISAGALGYVTKSDLTTDLIPAIRSALEGQLYISQSIPF